MLPEPMSRYFFRRARSADRPRDVAISTIRSRTHHQEPEPRGSFVKSRENSAWTAGGGADAGASFGRRKASHRIRSAATGRAYRPAAPEDAYPAHSSATR